MIKQVNDPREEGGGSGFTDHVKNNSNKYIGGIILLFVLIAIFNA